MGKIKNTKNIVLNKIYISFFVSFHNVMDNILSYTPNTNNYQLKRQKIPRQLKNSEY